MSRFLILHELKKVDNSITYSRPKWYEDAGLGKKEINLANTTLADTFVDVVVQTDDPNEIVLLRGNGAVELTEKQFSSWHEMKLLILQAQESMTDGD